MMTQNTYDIERQNIDRFQCENCGANMAFDAAVGGMLCGRCGHTQAVVAAGVVEEQSFQRYLNNGLTLQPMAVDAMQATCLTCGATVNFTPPETAGRCDFCGVEIVAQPKAADPLVAPNGVLPFAVTNEGAIGQFKGWLGSLWFAPSDLQKMASADKLSSIYIPYWTYDAGTVSDYEGSRGEHYTDIETYSENGQTKTRSVTKTRWYPASGTVSRHFDDVCVPATMSLPTQYLEKLEPWDLQELRSYEPAFLSGHKAQTYQLPLERGFERFKEMIYSQIEEDCRDDIGGDVQQVGNVNTAYSDVTFKHLLLPIYAGAYRYGGSIYQIVINARTGEVQGGRPYSWLKIGALTVAILIIVLIVLAFLTK